MDSEARRPIRWRSLIALFGVSGLLSWWVYVAIVVLSRDFRYEIPGRERPLLAVLFLLGAAFLLYLLQVACVLSTQSETTPTSGPDRHTLSLIVVFDIAFRLVLLFSEPIQEVDIYRYLWDGQVVGSGGNPYRYSPHHVLAADSHGPLPAGLERLADLRDRSPTTAAILSRVHFGELTSVYPPVSQAVFALAALLTPEQAGLPMHLLVMKSLIVLFDLATLGMLVLLLRQAGLPQEWCLMYAWCPLVLKEFANSGHLDSIAVFLAISALSAAVRLLYPAGMTGSGIPETSSRRWLWISAVLLALGAGAKIFPIIFAPLLILSAWRRVGRMQALGAAAVIVSLTAMFIIPMIWREPDRTLTPCPQSASPVNHPTVDPETTGLSAFASQWQMNDFLFLMLLENLQPPTDAFLADGRPAIVDDPARDHPTPETGSVPTASRPSQQTSTRPVEPWFAVTPRHWRIDFATAVSKATSMPPRRATFLVARGMTGLVLAGILLWCAWKAGHAETSAGWLRYGFLSIAWFWLLLPTQNPWYWIWAIPLLPFARSRAWIVVSGLAMLYYARFWFADDTLSVQLFGSLYQGTWIFDYLVVWIEYGPWFLWLAAESFRAGCRGN